MSWKDFTVRKMCATRVLLKAMRTSFQMTIHVTTIPKGKEREYRRATRNHDEILVPTKVDCMSRL